MQPEGCGVTGCVSDGFPAVNHHAGILTCRCVPEASHVALSTPGYATPTRCRVHQLQSQAQIVSGGWHTGCSVRPRVLLGL